MGIEWAEQAQILTVLSTGVASDGGGKKIKIKSHFTSSNFKLKKRSLTVFNGKMLFNS